MRVISTDVGWIGRQTNDGLTQNKNWYGGASVEVQQQIKLNLYYSNGFYRPVGSKRGQWSDDMNHDRYWSVGLDFNTRSSFLGYGAAYSWGELGGGVYGYLAPYLWIKPTNNTFLNVTTERLHSFGSFDQTIVSGGWDITKQDGIVFRYISANGDNFYRLAYNHQVQKGINVFAVYDKEPTTPAQFSVKLVFALPVSTSNFLKLVGAGSPQTPSLYDKVIEALGITTVNNPGTPIKDAKPFATKSDGNETPSPENATRPEAKEPQLSPEK